MLSIVKEAVVSSGAERTYYESFADATVAVRMGGAGTWSVADIAYAGGAHTDQKPSYYAGWALVVVYQDAHLGDAEVTVFDGAALVSSTAHQTFTITTDPSNYLRVGVVAWEGDRDLTGDRLELADAAAHNPAWAPLTPLDSVGNSDNALDLTVLGSRHPNTFGVDVKGFRAQTPPGAQSTIRATSSGDRYILGALTTWAPAPAD